jgi:hypothetical protein
MRKSPVVLFLLCLFILWLAVVVYIAGLPVSPSSEISPSSETTGVKQEAAAPTTAVPGVFRFEDTNLLVADLQLDLPNDTMTKEVFFIRGDDVDDKGYADSWLYGITNPMGLPATHIYDWRGWTSTPWTGTLHYSALNTSTLYPLTDLFNENRILLERPDGAERLVEVYNDTYKITITAGKTAKRYVFNANTGVLVEPNEE